MKASELRLGNIVTIANESNEPIVKITHIGDDDMLKGENTGNAQIKYEFNAARCIPIKLTEQWLLKFGFKKISDNHILIESYHYENSNCWIYLIEDGFEFELNTGPERNNLFRTYKYVHKLQNLYQSITGEELTVNQ